MRIFLKILSFSIIVFLLEFFYLLFFSKQTKSVNFLESNKVIYAPVHQNIIEFEKEDDIPKKIEPKNSKIILSVPYVSEAPEGNWSGNWVNACEEATIAMVDAYYNKVSEVSIFDATQILQKMFDEEDKIFGSNKNTNANQIKEIVNHLFSFEVDIKINPTIDDIKAQIDLGRPVISLHFGFDLQNKNIPFSPILSSYHTIVIVGYDDSKKTFIAHDPGDDKDGKNIYYSYEIVMNSLHDYNSETDKTDGVPTVLFTNKVN